MNYQLALKLCKCNTISLRRLGYSNDGDKLEESDKYLLKMEGCIKLYAAIIQGPPSFSNMVWYLNDIALFRCLSTSRLL